MFKIIWNGIIDSHSPFNGIFKTNPVPLIPFLTPFRLFLSHLFSLEWQSRSCLVGNEKDRNDRPSKARTEL
jgi:hypothetical protein